MDHRKDLERARQARGPARWALVCAGGAVVVLLVLAGFASVLVVLAGLAGLVLFAAGVWLALARRGLARAVGGLVAVGAPVGVLVLYAVTGLWVAALAVLALWAAALTCAQVALHRERPPRPVRGVPVPPPRQPVLIMNPKSGGGKVGRFRLVEKAEALGARVVLLDTSAQQDVAALAREALDAGADLLGVAGGDGTQALVAQVAADADVPFLVVSAGTRNHFAMDLGLDRTDPATCLDALTDGEELRVDLGEVAGQAFVNTVSFGAYAAIVQSPDYRDAKVGTALDALPELLAGGSGGRLTVRLDEAVLDDPQALLVSNNPYAGADPLGADRRPRLDTGTLGVIGIRVTGTADAAEVALLGAQARGLNVLTSREVVVEADEESIPVAVDGEALTLSTPVRCRLRAGALRVRVPRNRPGTRTPPPRADWRRVTALALARTESGGGDA